MLRCHMSFIKCHREFFDYQPNRYSRQVRRVILDCALEKRRCRHDTIHTSMSLKLDSSTWKRHSIDMFAVNHSFYTLISVRVHCTTCRVVCASFSNHPRNREIR